MKLTNFTLICGFLKASQLVSHRLREVTHRTVAAAWSTVVEVDTDLTRSTTFTNLCTTTVHGWPSVSLLQGGERECVLGGGGKERVGWWKGERERERVGKPAIYAITEDWCY